MERFWGEEERVIILEKGKRGVLKMVFGRTGVVLVLMLVQLGFLLAGMHWLEQYMTYLWAGNALVGTAIVLHILNSDDNPTVKLTWAVIIMIMPVFGLLLYLYIHMDLGHRVMKAWHGLIVKGSEPMTRPEPRVTEAVKQEAGDLEGVSNYLQRCGFPSFDGTSVQYFPLGEDKFEEMLRQLEQAEKFIFMEYFIVDEGYMWGRILDVLERKARQGVEVRVMYDGTCALYLLPWNYPKKLQAMGIQCRMFSPLRPLVSTHYNNRDHRKILVIDGHTAFTGGVNLADEYINRREVYGHWKDTAIMLKGSAVRSFTLMFLQMWITETGEHEGLEKYLEACTPVEAPGFVIPFGDSPLDNDPVGEMVYMDIINQAKRYVHIMTPYLILDNEMVTALTFAAQRGVDVKLILPHVPDKEFAFALAHGHYPRLIAAGVKIYEYTPGFVHAKVFVSDDIKAVVGTINLDYRSLYHHFECAAYLHGVPAVADIEQDVQNTLRKCQRMAAEDVKKDRLLRKLMTHCLRLVAPLM